MVTKPKIGSNNVQPNKICNLQQSIRKFAISNPDIWVLTWKYAKNFRQWHGSDCSNARGVEKSIL